MSARLITERLTNKMPTLRKVLLTRFVYFRFIGALYGRFVGLILVKILMYSGSHDPQMWAWIDPGAFALIGAASFFGGVTRLTMAVTVIMASGFFSSSKFYHAEYKVGIVIHLCRDDNLFRFFFSFNSLLFTWWC